MAWIRVLLVCAALLSADAAAGTNVGNFIRRDVFNDIKISPTGEYYAATAFKGDRTVLIVMRRADLAVTGSVTLGKNSHVGDFWWVNPERLVYSVAEKFDMLDQPRETGELFGMNADGSKKENLLGFRVQNSSQATHIKPKKVEDVAGYMVDTLASDDRNVVITVRPFGDLQYTRAEKLDVYSGRRTVLARSPVPEADFLTDASGVVRFAFGTTARNHSQLHYRSGDGEDWQLLNDEAVTHRVETPLGFTADGSRAYLRVEHAEGPDSIVLLDPASGERSPVLRNPNVDPDAVMYSLDGRGTPIGVVFEDGKPVAQYFEPESAEARLRRALAGAFPDDAVQVTSRTQDGQWALVQVASDRNPGDFYLFDVQAKQMSHLLSRREWIDPEQMTPARPIQVKARDGLLLHGLLTAPGAGKNLPTIVLVHGGPFGIRDRWGFNSEAQMLAQSGYAVLQINFRGSGGYGRAFLDQGARQWGGKMQDDVTDATRWAIESGVADPSRICIYGASYGAYAALMGLARESSLYRCGAGYVGVYDLPLMHSLGDIRNRVIGRNYLSDWIGEPRTLGAISPVNLADRIKVPVFMAAGGEDARAPVEHTERMEQRLKQAGVPVETLYFRTEGHGFYREASEQEYYTRLLAFFATHLGNGDTRQ